MGSAGRTQHLNLHYRELLHRYTQSKNAKRINELKNFNLSSHEGLSALQRVTATQPLSCDGEGRSPCPSVCWPQAGYPGQGMQGEAAGTDAFLQLQPSPDSTVLLNTKHFFLSSLSLWTEILKKFKHVVWANSFLFPFPCLCLVWLPNGEKHKYLLSFILRPAIYFCSIQYHQHQTLSFSHQGWNVFCLPR